MYRSWKITKISQYILNINMYVYIYKFGSSTVYFYI